MLRNKSIPVLIARFMAAMLGDQLPQSERKVRSRERVRSKYSCGFPLERCKLLTRWAFEYFDQTTKR